MWSTQGHPTRKDLKIHRLTEPQEARGSKTLSPLTVLFVNVTSRFLYKENGEGEERNPPTTYCACIFPRILAALRKLPMMKSRFILVMYLMLMPFGQAS